MTQKTPGITLPRNPQDILKELPTELSQASHFIDGKFVTGSGDQHENYYPATGKSFTSTKWAIDDEITAAINAAQKGYQIWRNYSPARRARILNDTARILRDRNRQISEIETLDTGKPLQETLEVDVASAAECLEYFAAQCAVQSGEYVGFSGEDGDWGYTRREPLGICVGIGAWNYPIQIAGWKSAPALACGNAFIFKPAQLTPLSALHLARAYRDAGLPDGVFQILQGDGSVGAKLVAHQDVAKVSLTGETATGIKILKSAADTIKNVTLELGGKSPLIIFDDADLDDAVGGTMLANFYSTGQVCSNGTRVFIHEKIRDAFVEKLITRTRALIIGDPLDETTQIGPLVSAKHFQKVSAYLKDAPEQGKLLWGGTPPSLSGFEDGYWVAPMIVEIIDNTVAVANEEVFGPLLSLFTFSDEEAVIEQANATPYGLAGAVFTNDMTRAHRVIARLQAGTCWINSYNLTPVELPFGGYKQSGVGRENGRHAIDAYSQIKSVYVTMDPVEYPY